MPITLIEAMYSPTNDQILLGLPGATISTLERVSLQQPIPPCSLRTAIVRVKGSNLHSRTDNLEYHVRGCLYYLASVTDWPKFSNQEIIDRLHQAVGRLKYEVNAEYASFDVWFHDGYAQSDIIPRTYMPQENQSENQKHAEEQPNPENAQALYELGVSFANGTDGKVKDFSKAFEFYKKAAKLGHIGAQCALGVMFSFGQGVKQNHSKSAKWYRKAAEQGAARAQNGLGTKYLKGWGVPQDFNEAFNWFSQAAEQGHAQAIGNLGLMYAEGKSVTQNPQKAIECFIEAAQQGDKAATYNHGRLYFFGQGVNRDIEKAAKLISTSANEGFPDAQVMLGKMYLNGDGVPKNQYLAFEWVKKSADNNNLQAIQEIFQYYMRGIGTEPNEKLAITYLEKAAQLGDSRAIEAIRQFKKPSNMIPLFKQIQNQGQLWFDAVKVNEDGYNAVLCQGRLGNTLISFGTAKIDETVKFIIEGGGVELQDANELRTMLVNLEMLEHLSGQCSAEQVLKELSTWRK